MSFLKRRLGLDRGSPLPVADQLDFVVGAWVLTYLFFSDWFVQNFTPLIIVVVLILSPLLHVVVNIIAFKIGKKRSRGDYNGSVNSKAFWAWSLFSACAKTTECDPSITSSVISCPR